MDISDLNKLIDNSRLVENKMKYYEARRIIKRQPKDIHEIKGHIEKSERNLKFVYDNLKLGYFDWCITGCYYAVYHIALALILSKGYSSKNNDATICVLIKEYYGEEINGNEITKEDLDLINSFFINYQDLLFYIQVKNKREEASYSTKYKFDKNDVERLQLRAIDFIDKAKNIVIV